MEKVENITLEQDTEKLGDLADMGPGVEEVNE